MHVPCRRVALLPLAALLLGPLVPAATPDALVLNDGKTIVGDVVDKGDTYTVKTKYGELTVGKADVRQIFKTPAAIAAEAEVLRNVAEGMHGEATQTQDPAERTRKLNAGLALLDRAMRTCAEARKVYTGSEGAPLDTAMQAIGETQRHLKASAPPTPQPSIPPPFVAPATPAPGDAPAVAPANVPKPGELAAPAMPSSPGAGLAPTPKMPETPKTPEELTADLASPDPRVRLAATRGLREETGEEILTALLAALKQETERYVLDGIELALPGHGAPALMKHDDTLKEIAEGGTAGQKTVLVRVLKIVGTDPAVRFLVEQFAAKVEAEIPLEVASALKKHRKLAIRPLTDAFRRAGRRTDVQIEIIKYIGVIGESDLGPRFILPFLESDAARNVVLHAFVRIDRPAIPVLLQYGLKGGSKTRNWSAQLLRYFMDIPQRNRSSDELGRWWVLHRRTVEAEAASWDKRDEELNWPVDIHDWQGYDRPLTDKDGNELRLWRYRSSRGRERMQMTDAAMKEARRESSKEDDQTNWKKKKWKKKQQR